MRPCRLSLLLALLITALVGAIPARADGPSLTVFAAQQDATGAIYPISPVTDRQGSPQPPLLSPGGYVMVSGAGMPPNQAVQAELDTGTHVIPLPYQPVAGAVQPTTDADGAFQNLTFALPADQMTDGAGRLFIVAGTAQQSAPVVIVTPAATTAGPQDKRAVAFGAGFFVLAMIVLFFLIRGLPTYPVRPTRGMRQPASGEAE